MNRRVVVPALAAAALAAPATAQAHVSVHPNIVPEGSFPTLTVRVPNEMDNAATTAVKIQLPPDVLAAQVLPPPGWKSKIKTQKLAKPVKTDDGTVTESVNEIDFSGGKIAPQQFGEFRIAMSIPGKAGDVLSFKTVQAYSNGQVVRWIGPADADQPAPTIDVVGKDQPAADVSGDAGPPSTLPASVTGGDTASSASSSAPATKTVEVKSNGASKGLAITALIIGALGLIAGVAALATRRRI